MVDLLLNGSMMMIFKKNPFANLLLIRIKVKVKTQFLEIRLIQNKIKKFVSPPAS